MSIADVVRGPDTGSGPAPGVWLLTGRPAAGITPKFTIRDARGDTYLIKLDPPALPELASAAEVISTKIFHAIGYHVPENYVIDLDPARIEIAPDATLRTRGHSERPVQRSDVEYWLKDRVRNQDGTIRVLASRFVQGTPVGQFRHHGTRGDDPNDIYPHEYHRQLRALRVFAAWLNHDDTKALNTLDAYIEGEGGEEYIRHYLLDFGATLGSGSTHSKRPNAGYEYYVEGDKILKGIFTLGLWSRDWAKVEYPDYASVGRYEADFFEPWLWKPKYPNPAFDRMDAADAFWAARIVSRFTDEMIGAIVATGQFSNPEAATYLTDVLIKRRDKVVQYWIRRTNPLDRFDVGRCADDELPQLTFDNAAVRVGAAAEGTRYSIRWSILDNLSGQQQPWGQVELWGARAGVPQAAWGPADDVGDRYTVAAIRTVHPDFPRWTEPVVVTLRDRAGDVRVVGIERPRDDPELRH